MKLKHYYYRNISRNSSIAVLIILNFKNVYPISERISKCINIYQHPDSKQFATKLPVCTFISNSDSIYRFFRKDVESWKHMFRIDRNKINLYCDYIKKLRIDVLKSRNTNAQNISDRPKSAPPSSKIKNNRNLFVRQNDTSADDSDLSSKNNRKESVKSKQVIMEKAKKIKLLDQAKIIDPDERDELMLLSLSLLKGICKEKIRYRQTKKQNQKLIYEKKRNIQHIRELKSAQSQRQQKKPKNMNLSH